VIKNTILFICAMLLLQNIKAQHNLSGTLTDSAKQQPIANAVVVLLNPKDSVLYKFTRSNVAGTFSFKNVTPGKYILTTAHKTYADYADELTINGDKELPQLYLQNKAQLLERVIITARSPIRIKGDTMIFLADSFKVGPNANVEDLLKKLPGLQVNAKGEIKAMGEKVEKVLVDGEEFFGDDPGMAVRNLRADAVKEVQVFDGKSDQATFTGVDDGKKTKTINLKLKENAKRGHFGKADVSGGLNNQQGNRYNSNLMFSKFRGKQKLAAYVLNGNINKDGLDWSDREKYGADDNDYEMNMDDDGSMWYTSTGNSDGEAHIDPQNGFLKNNNAGLQFTDVLNGKHKINIAPKFNSQIYNKQTLNFNKTLLKDSVLISNGTSNETINRYNFKNKASVDFKLDSLSSLKITVGANFYNTQNNSGNTNTTNGETGVLKNNSTSINTATSTKTLLSATALYRQKFKKDRRSLALKIALKQLENEQDALLQSTSNVFTNNTTSFTQVFNQTKNSTGVNNNFDAKLTYTEPLSKKIALELAHEVTFTNGKNTLLTNEFSPSTGKYELFIDTLSNNFNQKITVQNPSVKISYKAKKFSYGFGSSFGITNFKFTDVTQNRLYTRNFVNLMPQANFNYKFNANGNLGFSFSGYNTQPRLEDLQPLRNNNNFFMQYIGNPNLKATFTTSYRINGNTYNFKNDSWKYFGLNYRRENNSITRSQIINTATGQTISQPVNTNGNYSVNFYGGGSKKIKKLNLSVGLNPNFNYSRRVDIINNQLSYANNTSFGLGFYAYKNKEDKYDVNIEFNPTFSSNSNAQIAATNKFWETSVALNATVNITKTLLIKNEVNSSFRQKTIQFPNPVNFTMWNATLEKRFKKNEFTAYFTVRDLLNQNQGINRNFWGNNTYETRNERLQRFWLLGFIWNFKNKAAAAPTTNEGTNN
jgi:hypothetical protein